LGSLVNIWLVSHLAAKQISPFMDIQMYNVYGWFFKIYIL